MTALLVTLTVLCVSGCGKEAPDRKAVMIGDTQEEASIPAFNKDFHIIKALWEELKALEEGGGPDYDSKRQALQTAIKERLQKIDTSDDTLTKDNRKLLKDIKRSL